VGTGVAIDRWCEHWHWGGNADCLNGDRDGWGGGVGTIVTWPQNGMIQVQRFDIMD